MRIVKDGREWLDDWHLLADDEALGASPAILPLARWLTESPAEGLSPHGVLVQPDDELAEVLAAARRSPLVAIEFPSFNDGRGYSFARQLRAAGYTGELRAVGDILRDQAFYLARCGFTSFAPAAHVSGAAIVAGLADFSQVYQPAADQRTIIQRLRHPR
jgi:uncharacterized protein (DUF934 family)